MICCRAGKVDLPLWLMPPVGSPAREILELWQSDGELGRVLREFSRKITNAMALGSHVIHEKPPPGGGWAPTVVIQGKVSHRLGGLQAPAGETPRFAQIYVHDPAEADLESATTIRIRYMKLPVGTPQPKRQALHRLLDYLHERLTACNRYVRDFKTALEKISHGEFEHNKLVLSADAKPAGGHDRRYNTDTGMKEVAVLMSDDKPGNRDIVLQPRGGNNLQFVHETHRSYDSLHYTTLFPEGEDSWNLGMKLRQQDEDGDPWQDDFADVSEDEQDGDDLPYRTLSQRQADYYDRAMERSNQLTIRDFYAYHLHERDADVNRGRQGERPTLFYAGRAFQEYLVMAFAKMENQRLSYLSSNAGQQKLRSEQYDQLIEAIQDPGGAPVGKRVVLPSTYIGSPRDMNSRYQDAMAIVRSAGKPDLFITMTCNPKWPEIQAELNPLMKAEDRHDLTARVFRGYLDGMLNDLLKDGVMGRRVANTHVIEFQKRGLPHAHILIMLHPDDKPRDGEDLDDYICAELPTEAGPLRDAVTEFMLHGECGATNPKAPCMDEDGTRCTKHFPKEFAPATLWDEHATHPTYRRRSPEAGGARFMHKGRIVDNRWVVPYNPYLLLKYQCHINVEHCNTVRACKYLFKYT